MRSACASTVEKIGPSSRKHVLRMRIDLLPLPRPLGQSVLLVLLVCGLLALASAAKHPEDDRHHRPGSEGRPAGGEHHHGSEGGEHHHGSEGSEPHHGHPRPEPEGDDAEGEEDSVSTATDGDDVPGIVEDEIEHVENDLEDKIASFWRNSKNKLVMAVYNLSEYLPISVEYATSVAHQCDLVANNRKYYTKVGLIISAVMLLSGLLFAFLGKCMRVGGWRGGGVYRAGGVRVLQCQ